MKLDIIPEENTKKEDTRNTKKRFLDSDCICLDCGAINNGVYENSCVICSCKGSSFITGDIGVDLRLLLNMNMEELKAIAYIRDINVSNRIGIILEVLKIYHPEIKGEIKGNKRIDKLLIRKIIVRNRRRLWYWKDIDSFIDTHIGNKKTNKKKINIRIIPKEDVIPE